MAGLFTLNSATLGVLNTNVLGGSGTGFVTGSNSSSGAVTGAKGSNAKPRGYPYLKKIKATVLAGTVSGVSRSSGSVRGSVNVGGSTSGDMRSIGDADGRSRLNVRPISFHAEGFVNSDFSETEKRRMKDEADLDLIGVW